MHHLIVDASSDEPITQTDEGEPIYLEVTGSRLVSLFHKCAQAIEARGITVDVEDNEDFKLFSRMKLKAVFVDADGKNMGVRELMLEKAYDEENVIAGRRLYIKSQMPAQEITKTDTYQKQKEKFEVIATQGLHYDEGVKTDSVVLGADDVVRLQYNAHMLEEIARNLDLDI